jgi:hypothetical protein
MGIFRSTDPTTFDDVDGIVINESAPSPNVQGVASNVAILIGLFQRGDYALAEAGSIGEIHENLGKSSFSGNIALKNKKFGRLKIVRVEAGGSAKAADTLEDSGATPTITFTAKWKGAYGNNIKIKVENGTTSGKKYSFQDTNANAVLSTEVYDNVAIATVVSSGVFAGSKLVDVTVLSTALDPVNQAYTSLAGGLDGTAVDADYQAAIDKCQVERAGNFIFLDVYNAARRAALKQHAADTTDKMVILAGDEVQSVSAVVTDVASYRDSDGRIIYAYPWVKSSIDGVDTFVSPASFYAAVLSQTAPNIDPAYSKNTQFLSGISGLKLALTRSNYISLKEAGVSAFEIDEDIGPKIKSGIVTQISDSSKVMVFRRRMADYLTDSIAKFLKNYQNAPNTKANRTAVKGAISAFVESNENAGILPKDSEVQSGLAKLIDTESLNTDSSIGQGFFKILYKQRIYSSMRYIVIQAEIGETVVVTEQG